MEAYWYFLAFMGFVVIGGISSLIWLNRAVLKEIEEMNQLLNGRFYGTEKKD